MSYTENCHYDLIELWATNSGFLIKYFFHKETCPIVFGKIEVENTMPDAVVTDHKVANIKLDFGGGASTRYEGRFLFLVSTLPAK